MAAPSERSLDSYNPFDPDVQEDPWHYYGLLRREAPVYKDPHTGLFMVSSYELVVQVLKDWELFSNRFGVAMGAANASESFAGWHIHLRTLEMAMLLFGYPSSSIQRRVPSGALLR